MRLRLFMLASIIMAMPCGAAEITLAELPDGKPVIHLTGAIQSGDYERLEALRPRAPRDTELSLVSQGGLIDEAIRMGGLVRAMGWSTTVPSRSICASACGLLWAAGTRRSLDETANVGFHAAFEVTGGRAVVSAPANALVGAYLAGLGIDAETIVYLTSAMPDQAHWIRGLPQVSQRLAYTLTRPPEAEGVTRVARSSDTVAMPSTPSARPADAPPTPVSATTTPSVTALRVASAAPVTPADSAPEPPTLTLAAPERARPVLRHAGTTRPAADLVDPVVRALVQLPHAKPDVPAPPKPKALKPKPARFWAQRGRAFRGGICWFRDASRC